MEITDAQKKKFEAYWHKCVAKCHLNQWHSKFKYPSTKKDYHAQVVMHQNVVTVHISHRFWNSTAAEKRWTVMHELLHMWLHPMTDLTMDLLAPWVQTVNPQVWHIASTAITKQEESFVEGFGFVAQELLPVWKD